MRNLKQVDNDQIKKTNPFTLIFQLLKKEFSLSQ
jgi:hypothetical protein